MNDPILVNYVDLSDVKVVLNRIPEEFRTRVRDVFLTDKSFAVRELGWGSRRRHDHSATAVLHGMFGVFRWPQTESIVMLGG